METMISEVLEKEVDGMCNFSVAVERIATRRGIEQGIEQGENRMSALNEYLIRDNRMEDMIRAIKDKIFRQELYVEYGIVTAN